MTGERLLSETVFLGIIRKLRDCRERWTVAITVEGGKCVKVMLDVNNGREYLQYVIECLNRRLKETDTAILEGTREIENMHEYYWENYTEMDQYGYEDFDNRQALQRQVNANEEQFLLRKRFRKMLDSPFFGRVDFLYEGDE